MPKVTKRRKTGEITEGNGRPLRPFRWWQWLSRALHTLTLTVDGRQVVYAIDVPYWERVATSDGKGKAHLYVDGRHAAQSRFPAALPVHGGRIEVEPTSFGLRRCHYVTDDGRIRRLTPDPRSAEGRRARLAREHPGWSRALAALSLVLVVVPVMLVVPQILDAISRVRRRSPSGSARSRRRSRCRSGSISCSGSALRRRASSARPGCAGIRSSTAATESLRSLQ